MEKYRKMMQNVKLSPAAEERIRRELTARCAQTNQKEEPSMNVKKLRKPIFIAVAAALCCALTATAFASGVVGRVYHHMTGGTSYHYENQDGTKGAVSTMDLDNLNAPAEVRDNRIYFTVGEEDRDITDECSEEIPYIYECTGEDGIRHAFIIGGAPDNLGWAEFLWDEEGIPEGGSAFNYLKPGNDTEWADWYLTGMEQLDLPWARFAPQNNVSE